MKIIAFLLFIMTLCHCKEPAKETASTSDKYSLHFVAADGAPIDPIALLNLKDSFHFIYAIPASTGLNQTNVIRQASSKDLLTWTESEHPVFPDQHDAILKGGIVIDSNNTSRFRKTKETVLVAILTRSEISHESDKEKKGLPLLAFSPDWGHTWTFVHDAIRLPPSLIDHPQHIQVHWHEATKKWVTSIALPNSTELYSSPDLRSWTFETMIGSDFFPEEIKWERTALFPAGDNAHWILLADVKRTGNFPSNGGTVFFIGYFDGRSFTNTSKQLHWLDYGRDIFGSLIGIGNDGRRISMGWKNAGSSSTGKNNQHRTITTIPRELNMDSLNTDEFLSISPVRELMDKHAEEKKFPAMSISYTAGDVDLISDVKTPFEMTLKFNTAQIVKGSFPKRFGVSFWNDQDKTELTAFVFDRFGFYYFDKNRQQPSPLANPAKMPFEHLDSTMTWHIIVDDGRIECFVENNKLVMTEFYTGPVSINSIKLFLEAGNIELIEGKIFELKSVIK